MAKSSGAGCFTLVVLAALFGSCSRGGGESQASSLAPAPSYAAPSIPSEETTDLSSYTKPADPTPAPDGESGPAEIETRPAPASEPYPMHKEDDHGGATAECRDGTLSYSANHRGTCSHHGGVAVWYR